MLFRSMNVKAGFLGNVRHPDGDTFVQNMLDAFRELGCNVSYKMHLLQAHLNRFPTNCGEKSDEHGELMHQTVKRFTGNYHGKLTVNAMGDFNYIHAVHDTTLYRRKSLKEQSKIKRERIRDTVLRKAENILSNKKLVKRQSRRAKKL